MSIGRGIASTLLLIAIISMCNINTTHACFSPVDMYAIEVLFNKPGIGYNLTILLSKYHENIFVVTEDNRIYALKYVYIDTYGNNISFGVTIYLEMFCGNAPCIKEINDDEPVSYVIGLRMELLELCNTSTDAINNENNRVENNINNLTKKIMICPDRSVISLAFIELLKAIVNEGVITNLNEDDINMIIEAISRNTISAGWNNRLMYNEQIDNRWAPYSYLVYNELIKGLIIRSPRCSYQLPLEVVEEVKNSKPALILKRQDMVSPTTVSREQLYLNGRAVVIAIILGITVAIATYIIWRIFYKI